MTDSKQDITDMLSMMENKFDDTFNNKSNDTFNNNNGENQLQTNKQQVKLVQQTSEKSQIQTKGHNNNSNVIQKQPNKQHESDWQQRKEKQYKVPAIIPSQCSQQDYADYKLQSPEKTLKQQHQNHHSQQQQQVISPGNNNHSTSILDYRDLQDKIQTALKKKNNSKFKQLNPSTSRYSAFGSNHQVRLSESSSDLMLSRFDEYEKKKEKDISRIKEELELRETQGLKFKPEINKKSAQIVQEMGGHVPIFQRFQRLLQQKQKYIQTGQQLKNLKQQQEYEQYLQEFQKHHKVPEQIRSYDAFYQEMIKWKERSKKGVEDVKKQIAEKELKSTNNFKPEINKNSQKIIQAKKATRLPIQDREIPFQRKFRSAIDEECTFKPKINKKKNK